jgi:hypothetical protein
MGRGRNIILAYIYRTVAMKNRRKWAVENDRLASNGLRVQGRAGKGTEQVYGKKEKKKVES